MLTIQAISMVVLLAILPTGILCYPGVSSSMMNLYDVDIEKMPCRPCGNDCHNCRYGIVLSLSCGVEECGKGPDETCGISGTCGDGMKCRCERCYGCSSVQWNECSRLASSTCLSGTAREMYFLRSRLPKG